MPRQNTGSVSKHRNKFLARISIQGTRISLGEYATEAEAREAIRRASVAPNTAPKPLQIEGIPVPDCAGVYLMDLGSGVVKAGRASNIRARCAVAQTHCVADVQLLAWAPGGAVEEVALHHVLKPWRIRRELYTLSSGVIIHAMRMRARAPTDAADTERETG